MPEAKFEKKKVVKTSDKSKDVKLKELKDIRRNLKRSTSSLSGTSSSSSSSSSSNTSSGTSSDSSSSNNSSSNISSHGNLQLPHQKKMHSDRTITKKLEARRSDHTKEMNVDSKSKYKDKPKSQKPAVISNKERGNIWPDKMDQERIRNTGEREKGRGRERNKDVYKIRDEGKVKNIEKMQNRDKINVRAEINDKEKNFIRNKRKMTENEKNKEMEKDNIRDRGIMEENVKEKGDTDKVPEVVRMKGSTVANDGMSQNERDNDKEKERHKERENERIKSDLAKERGISKSKIDLNVMEKSHQIEEEKVPRKSNKIHATKLTRNITSAHLKEIFATWGPVTCVDLPMDHFHPEFNRGFAFIEYENPAPVPLAIAAMNCGQLDGQEISVVEVPVPREYERVRRPPRTNESRRYDGRSPLRRPRSHTRRSPKHSAPHRRYPRRSPPRFRRRSRSPLTPVRRNGKERRSPIVRRRSKSLPSRSR